MESVLNSISSKEHWTITCAAGSTLPKVSLYWESDDWSGLPDKEVIAVALFTGGEWKRQGETNADDITPHDLDTIGGHITTRIPIMGSGDITFGFAYPTIDWNYSAPNDVFGDKINWSAGRRAPGSTVNIRVAVNGENHPIVKTAGECYDMTIGSSGVLEIADGQTLTVRGNAVIEGQLILGTDSRISFLKDVDASAAEVVAAEGSKVLINGSVNQKVAISSCHDIEFAGSKSNAKFTKTLTGDIQINGNLAVMQYTTFNPGAYKINLKGDFSINQSASFTSGASTLVMCGDKKQKLSITPNRPLNNLTINNSFSSDGESSVDLGTGIVVTGHLELEKGILYSKSGARLSLGNNATSSIGKSDSYVIGQMQKTGRADFVFPIGSSERLAQVGISQLSSEAYIVAEYLNSKPQNVLALSGDILKISHQEMWHLDNNGSAEACVSLYWSDSIYSQINELATLYVTAYTDGLWKSFGQNAAKSRGNLDASGHVTSSQKITIKGSSGSSGMRQSARRTLNSTPHTLASNSGVTVTFGTSNPPLNPLPIELVSFDAAVAPNNTDVRLTWSTASEHNNAYFTIEHMFDGEAAIIDTVEARGGVGEGADYSYLHINQPAGTHYYRLQQTDFDGTVTVASDWVAVVVESGDQPVLSASVAPNPGKCQNIRISVTGISDGKFRYVVTSMSGQTIIDRTIGTAGANSYQIDATDWNLQPAMYLIKVFTSDNQTVSKFVVE